MTWALQRQLTDKQLQILVLKADKVTALYLSALLICQWFMALSVILTSQSVPVHEVMLCDRAGVLICFLSFCNAGDGGGWMEWEASSAYTLHQYFDLMLRKFASILRQNSKLC